MAQIPQYNPSKNEHPFGMLMPGRQASSTANKYGFNGKEKDDEVKGVGNSLDFGARIYDNRLGRWLSVDPLQQKYVGFSPYNFAINSPLQYKDYDGRDLFAAGKQSQAMVKKALREAFGNDVAKGFEFDANNKLYVKTDTYDKLDLPIQKVIYEKFVKRIVDNQDLSIHVYNTDYALEPDGTPVTLHTGNPQTHELTWIKKTSNECWYGELYVGEGEGGLAEIEQVTETGQHKSAIMSESEGFWHGIGHVMYGVENELDNSLPFDPSKELKMIEADQKTVGLHNAFKSIGTTIDGQTYTGNDQHIETFSSGNRLYTRPYNGSGANNDIMNEQPQGNPNK